MQYDWANDLNTHIPKERVESAFEQVLRTHYTNLVSLCLVRDFDRASKEAEWLRDMELIREDVHITYNTRQMTLGELKTMLDKVLAPSPDVVRPTAWERLLSGVE